MSDTRQRKHFTGQEKVAILRRRLGDKAPVSDLCEEHGIHPTLFYRRQKDWFEHGAVGTILEHPTGLIQGCLYCHGPEDGARSAVLDESTMQAILESVWLIGRRRPNRPAVCLSSTPCVGDASR